MGMEPEVSSSYSDEDIVEGLKNGDPFATEILIKKHGNDLGHAIQSGCGKFPGLKNPSDIEDALQETFLKITRSINSFDPGKASFPTWATEIALNAAIDHGRKYLGWGKKGHQPKRVIWLRLEKLQQLCNDNHISEEKMSHILRSMDNKHPNYYFAFHMTFGDKLMPHEIAEHFSTDQQPVSSNTVSVWLSRAFDWLEKEIRKEINKIQDIAQ